MADPVYQADIEQGSKPIPQLDTTSYASQLFWLAVVFIALYLIMARSVIPRIREVLAKRHNHIQHDLDVAEKARQEAGSAKAAYEAELETARTQATRLLQDVQSEIEAIHAAEHQKLGESIEQKITASQAAISEQREASLKEMKPLIQELTAEISGKFLSKKPGKTAINKSLKATEGM